MFDVIFDSLVRQSVCAAWMYVWGFKELACLPDPSQWVSFEADVA
jgi:hypothetical protein